IGDAALVQPDRPVAHEGAGGEHVGRAEAREPEAREVALHQAANSPRTWSVCWPSSGTSPSRAGSPLYAAASAGMEMSPLDEPELVRRSCGCLDRAAMSLTRAQAICAASSLAASSAKLFAPKLLATIWFVASRRSLRAMPVA